MYSLWCSEIYSWHKGACLLSIAGPNQRADKDLRQLTFSHRNNLGSIINETSTVQIKKKTKKHLNR